MKLIAAASSALPVVGHAETHPHDTPDGLEWEDLMPDINRATDSCNMIWKLVDHDTGQANWEIDGAFTVGDQFSSSAVLAGALLAGERVVRVGRRLLAVGQLTRLSAIGLSVGTLAALAIAHTPGGLFGFRETGLRPAPQTLVVITIETLATILLTVAIHQAHRAVRSEDATEDLEHPRRHVAEAA